MIIKSILLAVEKVFRDARRNRSDGWINLKEIREEAKKYLFPEDVEKLHLVDYPKRIRGVVHHLFKDMGYLEKKKHVRGVYRLNLNNSKVKKWFNMPDSYTDIYSIDGRQN